MTASHIFTLGESVLDIIFRDGRAVSSTPGGAMLNSAVSLGRLGQSVFLISEISNDLCGGFILDFLRKNRVRTDYLNIYESGKTPVAIAALDNRNEASYDFYFINKENCPFGIPDFTDKDILLFGSFYSLKEENRAKVTDVVEAAKKAGMVVIYDPNIRSAHCPLSAREKEYLRENIELSDIIRASDEDFYNVFGITGAGEAYEFIRGWGDKYLFYTSGSAGAWAFGKERTVFVPSQNIQPVSAIGAGDTFNAAVAYGIARYRKKNVKLEQLTEEDFRTIMEFAVSMATSVCLTEENYIPAERLKKAINF